MKLTSLCILLICVLAAANIHADPGRVPPGSKDERALIDAAFNLDVGSVERLVKAGVSVHAIYGSSEDEKHFQDPWMGGWIPSSTFQGWNALIAVANSNTYPAPRWYDDVEKMTFEDIRRHLKQMPEDWIPERNERRVKIATLLVDSGIDIPNDDSVYIALESAVCNGYKELALFLMNGGAKVVRPQPDGFVNGLNPLHRAIGCADMVAALLGAGAPVNAQLDSSAGHGMSFKDTPLHWAVRMGDLASVKLLVDAGANVNLTNKSGYTPGQLIDDSYPSPMNRAIARLLAKSTPTSGAEQPGADQPATKPADNTPMNVQPSTPTPKDGPR
jgi:hypothetical protein